MGLFGLSPIPDITNFLHGGGGGLSADPSVSPSKANWIKTGFAPAFSAVEKGTATAADYLSKAYEGQYRQRLGGLTAGYEDTTQRLANQGASQGTSADVLQRMMLGQGAQFENAVGQARGEEEFGKNVDLAQLFKGTATEEAGLTEDQLGVMANYISALTGAKSTMQGAGIAGISNLLGAGIKALPFL